MGYGDGFAYLTLVHAFGSFDFLILFAERSGASGVIPRIRLLDRNSRARDIRRFSAFADENEVVLLPNFKTMVAQEATYDASIGMDVIDLNELAEGIAIY